ncbi:Homeodomain-like protein, partial [Fomitopsis serialis]|uniref:Homeodomain-like protein n=1 Tax=Fomitopsis serialis TaxID=139415 RepID=UPI00200889C9
MQSPDEVFQPRDRRPWTEEEDEMLRMAIEEEDPESSPPTRWHAISQHIPNRTNKDCRKRWWAQMATIVSKGSWTSDEDERLCRAVDELGPKWALVANRVRTRNSGQCAKRWNDALNPTIDRSGWTREEDEQLLRAVEQQGHSWANIARTSLPGRTGLAAKNRYNHLMRGACRQAGRRRSRTSPMTTEKRRTRGISEASAPMFHGTSSRSESGTTPSTPRSLPEGDEVHLYTATNAAEFADAEMLSHLSVRLPSPMAPASGIERQFMDFFSPNMFGDSAAAEASSAASLLYNPPSPSHAGVSQQHASSLYHSHPVTPGGNASEVQNPAGDSLFAHTDYLALYPPSNLSRQSPYLTQSIPDLSSLALDAQVTIGSLPAFPDKASVQLAQQAVDPSDRRVAVAVAICDQQDVISTVHSLSHSLSSMLGQGQAPGRKTRRRQR